MRLEKEEKQKEEMEKEKKKGSKLQELIPNCQYFGKYKKEDEIFLEKFLQEFESNSFKNVEEEVERVFGKGENDFVVRCPLL